ncbi:MAG TPA: hypothetical protein VGK25_09040, partial [Ignavibacteria bacterium]
DFYYYIRVKNQTSKIYFELGEYESLLSLLDTFRHYLVSTPTIPDFIRTRFVDYTIFLAKAVHARLAENNFMLNKIKEEVATAPVFENKAWLLENL